MKHKIKRIIIPGEVATKDMHQYILGSVAPRPIALVSTVDDRGRINLAPYSFFNAFSSNPPIVVFSSNRRVSDNTTKDTLHNIQSTGECVINMVSYDIVRQMAISSVEYDSDINEFIKSGLHPRSSDIVHPPGVSESPVNMECKVKEVITLGHHGGAGHLIICEILRLHVSEDVLDGDRINPHKIDLVGRMGRAFYTRASGDAVFTLYQNILEKPIGFDRLPDVALTSNILTGNQLAAMAGLKDWPDSSTVKAWENYIRDNLSKNDNDHFYKMASVYIQNGEPDQALGLMVAWQKAIDEQS